MENHFAKRIFLAVNLESKIKKEISLIQNVITSGNSVIKWVKPELMHITLEFFGNQSKDKIQLISGIVRKITDNCKEFNIGISLNIGAFPSIKKPKIIWVGIEKGNDELKGLSHLIKTELKRNHFMTVDAEFRSHITIGRIKYLKDLDLSKYSTRSTTTKNNSQTVKSIELMESNLTRYGPIYQVVESFPFINKC